MLKISPSYIHAITSEDGKKLIVTDKVGMSTGNGVNGFNPPNQIYQGEDGQTLPLIDDYTLVLYARLKNVEPIEQEYISFTVTRNNYISSKRTLTQVEFDDPDFEYSNIAYEWDVELPRQGIVLLYMVLIPNDDVNSKYYVDTTDMVVKYLDDNLVVQVATADQVIDYYSSSLGLKKCLQAPRISMEYDSLIKKYNRLLFNNKECSQEELDKLTSVQRLIRNMYMGAITASQSEDDYTAQKHIEYLENFIAEQMHYELS